MENYKQKYEAALEQAKQELKACGSLNCDAARQIFRLFPELQSIKNERIKTNIIKLLRFVRDTHHQYFDECNEAIEWLENNPMFDMSKIKFKVGDYTMKTIINEVKRLNNDINNTITELVKARLAHNDAAVANIHHKMESLMVETQQVCSFIIDNLPNENLDEAADCYLENIQPVGFMEGDYDGSQILDTFRAGANWQKEQMMKSAIDATCVILPSPNLFKVLICHEVTDKLANKQKIKILIVKEDEQ